MPRKNYHHGDLKNALIKAGVEILSKEGIEGLSLRKVAQRAGVRHSAPYSHFPDKQSLIAAISTEGFNQLYSELDAAVLANSKNPKKQLQQGALAYLQFALKNTDTFKIMFSGALEMEKEYPAFVEISHRTFQRVVDVVKACLSLDGMMTGVPDAERCAGLLAGWGNTSGLDALVGMGVAIG